MERGINRFAADYVALINLFLFRLCTCHAVSAANGLAIQP
jgi:hypothetical protein